MSLAPKLIALMARVAAAWNPADKSSAITLSQRNTLATRDSSAAGFYRSCRAQSGRSSGKRYFEITVTVGFVSPADTVMGFGTTAATLNDFVGVDAFGYGISTGGIFFHNTLTTALLPSISTGDVLRFALDLDGLLFWVSVVGHAWNANGSADPATGVGGLPINAGTYFPMFSGAEDTQASTLNGGYTAFAGTLPSGFTVWG